MNTLFQWFLKPKLEKGLKIVEDGFYDITIRHPRSKQFAQVIFENGELTQINENDPDIYKSLGYSSIEDFCKETNFSLIFRNDTCIFYISEV